MNTISNKIDRKPIKKKKKSSLSKKYKLFLNNDNIKLTHKSPTNLEDIQINVIKKDDPQGKITPKKIIPKKNIPKKIDNIKRKKSMKKKKIKKSKRKKLISTKKKKISPNILSLLSNNTPTKNIKKKLPRKNKTSKETPIISDHEIKKELQKKGIHIKGKQKQLMRDIYFFSKSGGINIHKE